MAVVWATAFGANCNCAILRRTYSFVTMCIDAFNSTSDKWANMENYKAMFWRVQFCCEHSVFELGRRMGSYIHVMMLRMATTSCWPLNIRPHASFTVNDDWLILFQPEFVDFRRLSANFNICPFRNVTLLANNILALRWICNNIQL